MTRMTHRATVTDAPWGPFEVTANPAETTTTDGVAMILIETTDGARSWTPADGVKIGAKIPAPSVAEILRNPALWDQYSI